MEKIIISNVKKVGYFFKFLWPSQNIWILLGNYFTKVVGYSRRHCWPNCSSSCTFAWYCWRYWDYSRWNWETLWQDCKRVSTFIYKNNLNPYLDNIYVPKDYFLNFSVLLMKSLIKRAYLPRKEKDYKLSQLPKNPIGPN